MWAPIALRAVALGIALIGLAGIGSVMGRTPAPLPLGPPAASVSHAELGLAALSERALELVTRAGSAPPEPGAPAPNGERAVVALAAAGELPSGADDSRERRISGSDGRGPEAAGAANSPCAEIREPRVTPAPVARVALNRADAAALKRLPGVGAKRAEAILALRSRLGRFRRPSDLLRIKGIGPRTLERMLPHLVLD